MIADGGEKLRAFFPAHSQYFLLLSPFTLTRILFMNSMERQFTRTGHPSETGKKATRRVEHSTVNGLQVCKRITPCSLAHIV